MEIGLDNQVNEINRAHGTKPDTDGYEIPQLAFKNRPTDDSSQGTTSSFLTYATVCNSVFTMEDDKFDEPPTTDRPVQQAWGAPPSIPKTLTTTVMSTPMSSLAPVSQANDELAKSEQERARLAREVSELREQVKILIEDRRKEKEKEKEKEKDQDVKTGSPGLPPINEIISIAVEASLNAMRVEYGNIPFEPPDNTNVNLNDQTMDSFAQENEE